jgi:hypothetical protein
MYVRLIARSDRGGTSIINNWDAAVIDRFEPLRLMRRLERRDEADVRRKTLPFVGEMKSLTIIAVQY